MRRSEGRAVASARSGLAVSRVRRSRATKDRAARGCSIRWDRRLAYRQIRLGERVNANPACSELAPAAHRKQRPPDGNSRSATSERIENLPRPMNVVRTWQTIFERAPLGDLERSENRIEERQHHGIIPIGGVILALPGFGINGSATMGRLVRLLSCRPARDS